MDEDKTKSMSGMIGGSAFLIRIQYRQNSTWQGTIQWLDEKKTVRFRSLLEMTMLMNEAMQKSMGEKDHEFQFKQWEEKEEVS